MIGSLGLLPVVTGALAMPTDTEPTVLDNAWGLATECYEQVVDTGHMLWGFGQALQQSDSSGHEQGHWLSKRWQRARSYVDVARLGLIRSDAKRAKIAKKIVARGHGTAAINATVSPTKRHALIDEKDPEQVNPELSFGLSLARLTAFQNHDRVLKSIAESNEYQPQQRIAAARALLTNNIKTAEKNRNSRRTNQDIQSILNTGLKIFNDTYRTMAPNFVTQSLQVYVETGKESIDKIASRTVREFCQLIDSAVDVLQRICSTQPSLLIEQLKTTGLTPLQRVVLVRALTRISAATAGRFVREQPPLRIPDEGDKISAADQLTHEVILRHMATQPASYLPELEAFARNSETQNLNGIPFAYMAAVAIMNTRDGNAPLAISIIRDEIVRRLQLGEDDQTLFDEAFVRETRGAFRVAEAVLFRRFQETITHEEGNPIQIRAALFLLHLSPNHPIANDRLHDEIAYLMREGRENEANTLADMLDKIMTV